MIDQKILNSSQLVNSLVDVGINYNNVKKVILENNIIIYKNLFEDLDGFIELLKQSEKNANNSCLFKDWQPWSVFGSYVFQIGLVPTEEDVKNMPDVYKKEQRFLDMVYNAFYFSTNDFVQQSIESVPKDWRIMGPSISKYNSAKLNNDNQKKLAMNFHTDYKYLETDWPGYQMILTCTMYLNDDYDGGEIIFKLPNKKLLTYKPTKGDVIVFPSGNPEFLSEEGIYFHAVNQAFKNDRYLIRCFYQKYYDGTQYWYDGIEKYGEEVWKKMEQERVKNENERKKVVKSDY